MIPRTMFRFAAAVPGLALLLSAAGPSAADAQQRYDWPPDWTVGATVERYAFLNDAAVGVKSLSLVTIPITAETEVMERFTVQLATALARGSLTRPSGESSSITGLTDTALRVALPVNELATVGLTLRVPTGRSTYGQDQLAVAGAIAADLLPFRISSWGTGGGIGLDVSGATPVGDYGVRYSAGYQVAGSFDPIEDADFSYRPGNELRARVVVDRSFDRSRKGALQIGMMRYGNDTLEGQNLYRAGNRYQLIGSYSLPAGAAGSAVAYGGLLHRSRGSALIPPGAVGQPLSDGPSQTLLLIGGGMRTMFQSYLVMPSADLRVFRSSDGLGQGAILSAGSAAEVPLGRTDFIDQGLLLVPTARLRLGRVLVVEGASSMVLGIEIGATARFGGNQ